MNKDNTEKAVLSIDSLPYEFKVLMNKRLLAWIMQNLPVKVMHTSSSLTGEEELYYMQKADDEKTTLKPEANLNVVPCKVFKLPDNFRLYVEKDLLAGLIELLPLQLRKARWSDASLNPLFVLTKIVPQRPLMCANLFDQSIPLNAKIEIGLK